MPLDASTTSAAYFSGDPGGGAWTCVGSPTVAQPATSTSMATRASALRSRDAASAVPGAAATDVLNALPDTDIVDVGD
ncbi:hypothetical protein [Mesorhizobium marinum]|uniref:hypothetical protein n=1 Tax=Mesorhizobium marinum TaxID=3228790 RepID=UPI0034655387